MIAEAVAEDAAFEEWTKKTAMSSGPTNWWSGCAGRYSRRRQQQQYAATHPGRIEECRP